MRGAMTVACAARYARCHRMFHGLSHIDVPVRDLERSRALYTEVLGFTVKKQGEGWIDLDTSTVVLRLMQTRRPEHLVTIRVLAGDVEAGLKALEAAGSKRHYDVMRTPDLELMGAVTDFDGHTIIVCRELTEDEYGFEPELPKELAWLPAADALLKSLLQAVPALFRALARRKVARAAEILTRERKASAVTEQDVVRGYIVATSKVTRYRVRPALIANGYNPDDYVEEFES